MISMINSFKVLIVITIVCTSVFTNSTPIINYKININSKVIVEGILTDIAGGGTREILFPSGYAIKYPVWIVSPTTPTSSTIIFLDSNNFSFRDFIDKRIHVEGEFFNVPGRKISNIHFTKPYDKIVVDTIYCVN